MQFAQKWEFSSQESFFSRGSGCYKRRELFAGSVSVHPCICICAEMPAVRKIKYSPKKMKYSPKNEIFSKNRSILQKSIPAIFSNLYSLDLLCVKAIGTPLSKGMEWVPAWLHPPALPPEDCSRTRRQRGIAHIELLNDGGQGAELCQPASKPERPGEEMLLCHAVAPASQACCR